MSASSDNQRPADHQGRGDGEADDGEPHSATLDLDQVGGFPDHLDLRVEQMKLGLGDRRRQVTLAEAVDLQPHPAKPSTGLLTRRRTPGYAI